MLGIRSSGCGLSDDDLVRLYSSGRESAFTALTDRYIGLIRSITSKYRVAGLEPDDLTQEGLMGLFCAVRSFDPEGGASFRTYLSLCINRRIISLLKRSEGNRSKALNDYIPIDDASLAQAYGSADPEDMYIGKENMRFLEEATMKLLSEKERKVLRLYLAGESYSEISQTLGVGRKSVDNAMQRIRKKLREHISNISL